MHKDRVVCNLTKGIIYSEELMPYISDNRGVVTQDLYKWILSRATPLNRKNSDKLYKLFSHSNLTDTLLMIKETHGLSINDNYWILESSRYGNLQWKDVSLYSNKLSESIAYLALTGRFIRVTGKETSAEFTIQGTYAKCVCTSGRDLILYKAGSNFEISAEVISAHIAEVLGIRTANYWYTTKFGMNTCASKVLTTEDISWESAFNMTAFTEQRYHLNIYDFASTFFKRDFYRMVLLDGIILNPDRHLHNWSFEIDGDSNEILRMAPCYDYNKAFTADKRTMSREIPNKNILDAAKEALEIAGIQESRIQWLFTCCDKYPPEFGETLYNRLLYILGRKETQRGCY